MNTSQPPHTPAPLYKNTAGLLWVFLGGSLGTFFRFVIGQVIALHTPFAPMSPHSPDPSLYSTFLVNIIGAFLLGAITAFFAPMLAHNDRHPRLARTARSWKLFLGTGFCGGFTTYSTFTSASLTLFSTTPHPALYGFFYVMATLLFGLAAAVAGWVLTRNTLRNHAKPASPWDPELYREGESD